MKIKKSNGKNIRSGKTSAYWGYVLFFLTMAVTVTASVIIYDKVNVVTQGNVAVVSVVMFLVIAFFSLACTVIDAFRRKFTTERPVERILYATEKISSGDFSVRIQPFHSYGKYDDYDLIIQNLNLMAEALGKSEILKNDFISNVSHEIKTPLAVIKNYASLLQSENLDYETREKHVKTVLRAAEKLSVLVTNVLKLNKLENQSAKPDLKKFNLTNSLSEAILQFEGAIESKNLSVDCNLDDITVYSSQSYLEIVWNNLLSNAVKFNKDGGYIGVSLKKQGANAVVKISDSGCGISPETGEHIFEKFYQGDTSHSQEGNGLGLTLVKKVIDVLGGEISVRSEKGNGSTFTIVIKGVVDE